MRHAPGSGLEEARVDLDVLLRREAGRADPALGEPYSRRRESGDALGETLVLTA